MTSEEIDKDSIAPEESVKTIEDKKPEEGENKVKDEEKPKEEEVEKENDKGKPKKEEVTPKKEQEKPEEEEGDLLTEILGSQEELYGTPKKSDFFSRIESSSAEESAVDAQEPEGSKYPHPRAPSHPPLPWGNTLDTNWDKCEKTLSPLPLRYALFYRLYLNHLFSHKQ